MRIPQQDFYPAFSTLEFPQWECIWLHVAQRYPVPAAERRTQFQGEQCLLKPILCNKRGRFYLGNDDWIAFRLHKKLLRLRILNSVRYTF